MGYDVAEWVRLNKVEGRNYAEIGRMFGVTRDTVKNQVTRYKEPSAEAPSSFVEVTDPHVLPDNFWGDMWENAKEQARLRQKLTKQQSVFHIKVNETLPILHVWTADWHLLDAGTDHDTFDCDLRIWRTTSGIYLGIGGDLGNWTSPAVLPRAMPANVMPSDVAEALIRRKAEEIHRQVLYGVLGNHDEFPGASGWHPADAIYRYLGIPNLGPGGRVFLTVGSVEYQIEARHAFNFNSALNDTNSHRQLWSQSGKPDMVFTAHLHHPTMHHRTFDGDDTIFARNGSFKQGDHYAKSKNFVHTQAEPPDQPGVVLFPDTKRMIPFRNYRDALPLLAALRGGR